MKTCRQCGQPFAGSPDGLCKDCRQLRDHPDALSKRKTLAGVPFEDAKQLDESARFQLIVNRLKERPGEVIGVMVDTGPGHEDKGDRYVRGIRALLPAVKLIRRTPGPAPGCETLVFQHEG